MIPVDQNIFGDHRGNCFAACLASILELPLAQIPHVMVHDDWWQRLVAWARGRGWEPIHLEETAKPGQRHWYWPGGGYAIAGGPCERGSRHACVYLDGHLVHDPHPTRAGLLEVDCWTLLVPLDPARRQPDSQRITSSTRRSSHDR